MGFPKVFFHNLILMTLGLLYLEEVLQLFIIRQFKFPSDGKMKNPWNKEYMKMFYL